MFAAGLRRSLATLTRRSFAAASIPAEMRAVVWRGDTDPLKMKVETLRTPSPKKDEVLVKVKACGVCHTDLHCIKHEVPFPAPAVFGHEISGEVVGVGEGVNMPLGTKVASPFIMPCGDCRFCHNGEEDTCEPFFTLNRGKGHLYDDTTRLFKQDGEEIAMYSFGGLAEYCVVPKTAVFQLPEGLANNFFAESSVLGCAFFTALGAIRNAAEFRHGSSCAVIGCGGVGGGVIQLLKHLGASKIIAIDVNDAALAQAKAIGATHTINSMQQDVVETINSLTDNHRVDICFEVIGLKQTFEQAMMCVRDGGKACYIGISDVKTRAEVPITHVVRRRISLAGSYGARASKDMPELLGIADAGGVDLTGAITQRFTLDNCAEGYSLMANRKLVGRGIVEMH